MKRLLAATSYIAAVTAVALVGACSTDEPEPSGARHEARPAVRPSPVEGPAVATEPQAGPSAGQRVGLGDPLEDFDSGGPALVALSPESPLSTDDPAVLPPPAEDRLSLPHDPDPEVDHLAEAEQALAGGDRKGALTSFRKAAFDSGSYESFMGIARTARGLKDRELAFEALEAAAEVDPSAAEPLIQAARMCIGTGELDRGLTLVARAIRREPERPDAHNVRGRLWMAREQYDKAILAFRRATELDDWHVWAHNNMGYVFLLTGRYEEAVASLEKATSLRPVKAYMWNNLGLAYEKLGRSTDARRAFDRAVGLNPEYVNARINLERVRQVAMVTSVPEEVEITKQPTP